jgi:uncharacterized protein (DUF885 family)
MTLAGLSARTKNFLRAGVIMLAGSAAAQAGDTESQRFAAFLDATYQKMLAASPQLATEFGGAAAGDRWDDLSETALAANALRVRRNMAEAKSRFDYDRLDSATQLQYRVFLDEQQLLLDRYRWRDHFYALNQIVGLHIDVPETLTTEQALQTEQDAQAYIRRIRAVRPTFRQLVRHMQAQAKRGIYIPKTVYPLLIEQARNTISGAPHGEGPDSPIFADFKRRVALLGIPDDHKARLIEAARSALMQDLQPAYEELIRLLETQAQHSPIDGGAWQLPDGDAFYAFLIRQFTTTNMTPLEVHDMGLAEVARSHCRNRRPHEQDRFHGILARFHEQGQNRPAQL